MVARVTGANRRARRPMEAMSSSDTPMNPDEAKRRFLAMLDEEGLPHYDSARHLPDIHMLELTWDHGLTFHFDLSHDELEPLDAEERLSILGLPPWMERRSSASN